MYSAQRSTAHQRGCGPGWRGPTADQGRRYHCSAHRSQPSRIPNSYGPATSSTSRRVIWNTLCTRMLGFGDHAGGAAVGFAAEQRVGGIVGGEADGTHGVHGEVEPQQLHGVERLGQHSECADEGQSQTHVGHAQLDVLVADAAAPGNRTYKGSELVVKDHNVRRALGHLGSRDPHGHAHVGGLQGGGVVGAIPGDCDRIGAVGVCE